MSCLNSGGAPSFRSIIAEGWDTTKLNRVSLVGGTNVPLYNWAITSYAPNGDVLAMTDDVMGSWTYSYDSMNRLTSGTATGGADDGLTLGWTYDRYGNRWAQNATGSGNASAVQPQLTFYGNTNRIDGWSYSASGNLLNDQIHTYTYDAENRIATLNGEPEYIYDAEGRRVAKTNSSGVATAVYVLGLGGEQVSELNGSGAWVHSNVFAGGGRLLASYEGPAGTDAAGYHYHLTDWLGTKRMQTTALGNQEETCMSYPFGDGLSCIPPGSDGTEHHYTQKERDIESGLDYFFARYFTSDLVRFMTPDFDDDNEDDPEPVPYAVLGNPQSLNLYAYVGDNPNSGIDLDGHVGGGGSDDATEDEDSEAANSEGQAAGPATQDEGFDFAAGPSGSGSGSDSEETSSSVATSGGWSADQNVKPSNWVFIPGVGWGQLHGWHGENTWYECVSCGNHLPERGRGGGPFSALNNDKMLPPGTLIGITKTCLYASQISDQFGGYAKTDAAIATGIGTAGTLSKATSFLGKYAPEVALIFGVSAGVEGTVSYVSGQVAKGNCP